MKLICYIKERIQIINYRQIQEKAIEMSKTMICKTKMSYNLWKRN